MLTYLLMKTSRHMKYKLDQQLNSLGITASQFAVMNQIELKKDKAIAYEIAEAMSSDRPTISGIIKRLVKINLVEKIENDLDKRSHYLSLTKEGLSLLTEVRLIADEISHQLFKGFSQEDKLNLEKYLNLIKKNMEV